MIKNIFFTVVTLILFGFRTFAQEDEGCPKLTDRKAIKLYKEAFGYFQDKHSAQAIPLFKDVIQLEPGVADSYYFMGYINFKLNENYKAAETYLLKAIEICPEVDIYAYYFLGDIYAGREEWAKTVQYLSEFVKDPALIDNDGDLNRAKDLLKWARFYDNMLNHPVPFDPHYINGICTVNHEYLPCISSDGEIAFYTRVLEMPPRKDDIYQQKYFKEALFYSDLVNGKFTGGQEMPYPFNSTENIGSVTVTLDNNHLFVAVGKTLADGYLNVDIYDSYKDAEGYWCTLDTVPNINGRRTWETQPSISSDGKTLYFVSDRVGGFGAGDIWCSHMDTKGKWSTPENLGPSINTSGEEKTPFIHTDSQTLYFTSGDAKDADGNVNGVGWPGVGGLDIFFSKHHEDGSWTKPINLGYPINTVADESGFSVSTSGKIGYYTSNKLNGPGGYDVYAFDLYKEARPEEVSLIKGEVTQMGDSNKPVKARIEIKNVVTKKITEIPVDSVTGKYVAALIFKNDYILTVKTEDCAYESKYLKKEDSSYVELTKVDFEVKPIVVGNSYRLNDIFFATKSSELNNESRSVLDGFIIFLKENPKIKVSIQGHTDNVGKPEDNLKLSEDRAKSVYEYLIANAIDAARLSYKGYGEGKPITTNDTPEGKARNRRTEFVIIEK
jgi:outer membrane protein OmpA-like peptidoglycan-associated protein